MPQARRPIPVHATRTGLTLGAAAAAAAALHILGLAPRHLLRIPAQPALCRAGGEGGYEATAGTRTSAQHHHQLHTKHPHPGPMQFVRWAAAGVCVCASMQQPPPPQRASSARLGWAGCARDEMNRNVGESQPLLRFLS
jgi:hypothetical protein